MPSKLKIKIVEARDLPIMDRNDASTDAYVVITIGDLEPKHTRTCRKSLNPVFNADFSFEVLDDSILQNAPIEFKVMDQDLYTSELIGSVYIDINTLIMRTAHGSEKDRIISGWFPLFDTIKGVRGSLNLVVALTDFIGNSNQFSDASSGVQFFSGSSLASNCFIVQEVLGFVTDLVVENDPESSWQDFFRKNNKTSNDQRLKLLYNLSAIVRCEIGKKVIEMGGNSVLGYCQTWDTIEGATGVVARAYGTACRILKVADASTFTLDTALSYFALDQMIVASYNSNLDAIERSISSDLDPTVTTFSADSLKLLQIDNRGNIRAMIPLTTFGPISDKILHQREVSSRGNASASMEDAYDVQLLTLSVFPSYARVRLGGLVVARSVKFLGKLEATLSDQETREEWWEELRDEIKAHARILCCTHICGYSETFAVYGDICVLSCMGTAATMTNLGRKVVGQQLAFLSPSQCRMKIPKVCEYTHVPYSHSRAPFQFMRLVPCLNCKKKWVPEIILSTIEPSPFLPIKGRGVLLEARACRIRKAAAGEIDAVKLSGILPFLEYDVQRQLMLKLKVLGMNAVFGYDSRLQIGANMVILTATCTACFVTSLPPPPQLQISKTIRDLNLQHEKRLQQLETDITDLSESNRLYLESEEDSLPIGASDSTEKDEKEEETDDKESLSSSSTSSSSDSDEEELESRSISSADGEDDVGIVRTSKEAKDVNDDSIAGLTRPRSKRVIRSKKKVFFKDDRPPFILEIDEETDADLTAVIEDWEAPIGVDVVNTIVVPGSSLYPEGDGQHVTLVKRSKLSKVQFTLNTMIGQMFSEMYSRLCYSVRGLGSTCQIVGLHHSISILDEEIVEVIMSAIAYKTTSRMKNNTIAFIASLPSRSESRLSSESRSNRGSVASVDDFFISKDSKDGLDHGISNSPPHVLDLKSRSVSWDKESLLDSVVKQRPRANSSISTVLSSVILSQLPNVPGYRIVKYLGQIQLHFVKDSLASRGEFSMDSFYHGFITEANAIIRAHVDALHGNALVNYRIYPLEAGGRVYRNQACNMLTLCGDVVELSQSFDFHIKN